MDLLVVIYVLRLKTVLNITGTGGFSGDSRKVLLPRSSSLCSAQSRLIATHSYLCVEDLRRRLFIQPRLHLTVSASLVKALSVRGAPPTRRPDPGAQDLAGRPVYSSVGSFSTASGFSPFTDCPFSIFDNHLHFLTPRLAWLGDDKHTITIDWTIPSLTLVSFKKLASASKHIVKEKINHGSVVSFEFASVLKISGGFTGVYYPSFMPYLSFVMNLLVDSPGLALYSSSFSLEEKILLPFPLPMERDVSSDSLPSVCFSLLIGLLSCGAVSTGPEDATEVTSVILVDEVWTLTSHYVTIFKLPDYVVKAPLTHPSFVLNSLSSSFEDLSCFIYLSVVFSVYDQRGWTIPSFYCIKKFKF